MKINILFLSVFFNTKIILPVLACSNLHNIPIYINNRDETVFVQGCINNQSFPKENVEQLNVDCDGTTTEIQTLVKNTVSYLPNLLELVIKCSIKNIEPGAFAYLPSISDLDLSGNQLTTINANLFNLIPSLLYLNMSNNAIAFIEDYALANLPRLADLDLSFNKLNTLNRKWFQNTTTIEEFRVNNNNLKAIPPNIFKGWKRTYGFIFDFNEIFEISDGAFAEVESEINYLSFHHNNLTSLNINAFKPKSGILQLDLSSNLLNNIPEEFLGSVTIRRIWIYGNPFDCNCLQKLQSGRIKIERPIIKMHREQRCRRDYDVPVCGILKAKTLCNNEDSELTNRLNINMMKLGFIDLKDWFEECTTFTRKEYLEI